MGKVRGGGLSLDFGRGLCERAADICLSARLPAACCSPPASCCGLGLRAASLWIAEGTTVVGLGLIIVSSISIDSMHRRFSPAFASYWSEYYYVPVGFGVFWLVTGLLLFAGILSGRALLAVPWLVLHSLQAALAAIAGAAGACLLAAHASPLPLAFPALFTGVAYAELFRHLLLVVWSHCRELSDGDLDCGASTHSDAECPPPPARSHTPAPPPRSPASALAPAPVHAHAHAPTPTRSPPPPAHSPAHSIARSPCCPHRCAAPAPPPPLPPPPAASLRTIKHTIA